MEETISLIEQIIAEHKSLRRRVQILEQAANDVEAIAGLDKTRDAFVPGRFDQHRGLKDLQEMLINIDRGLAEHFNREETALLAAFEKYGDRELAEQLRSLLLEHEDLRNRFTRSQEHANELASHTLSRHLWEASANDMRAHLSHTRKLLEAHAEIEQELLHTLRQRLKREQQS